MKTDVKATGQRIKEIRKQRNMTQEKLAEIAEITPHYVYEIESGLKSMSIHILASISNVLNVSADYLLFGDTLLEADYPSKHDALWELTRHLTLEQRNQIAEILSAIIPHLKDNT